MEAWPNFERRAPQASEFDLAGCGLVDALLHDRDAPLSGRLMINAKISHDWRDLRVICSQQGSELFLGGLVCGYKGCFLGIYLQSELLESGMKFSIGCN